MPIMIDTFRLALKFWGVRGSSPTPVIENLNYGGNTPCVEVRLPDNEVLILDGGTGIRNLGDSLIKEFEGQKLDLKVFLTHFHWDHIQGIPFFQPLYKEENKITFYSFPFPETGANRRLGAVKGLEETLKGQMTDPYFPITLDFLPAQKEYIEIEAEPIKIGPVTIHPFYLNHPGSSFGYRLECEGTSIVYATDLEHGSQEHDRVLREYCEGTDFLIFDSQFTPEDYPKHNGWGHSTWLEACKVANDSRVKRLALFHHNPSYTDHTFFGIVQQARRKFENTMGAQEGFTISL